MQNSTKIQLMALLLCLVPVEMYAQDVQIPTKEIAEVEEGKEEFGPAHILVEPFTADTLESGRWILGTFVNYGITDRVMLGFDIISMAIGAPNISLKSYVWSNKRHSVSLGLKAVYLDKKTVLWGSMNDHFDELELRTAQPLIAYTRTISPRLRIHTAWSFAVGEVTAELSEEGRRKLFEAKYPNGDFDTGDKDTTDDVESDEDHPVDSSQNQAKVRNESNTYAQRTQQVSSITGASSDVFQVTGEITRQNGNKILVTTRIDQTRIKELEANNFRFTLAQQWIWDHFNFRLGVGLQYLVLTGRDLDGEKLDEAGVLPASDINFYWRF